jgi:hypothetical protein
VADASVVCDGEEEDSIDNDNMADASVVCEGEEDSSENNNEACASVVCDVRRMAVITRMWLMSVQCVIVRRRTAVITTT